MIKQEMGVFPGKQPEVATRSLLPKLPARALVENPTSKSIVFNPEVGEVEIVGKGEVILLGKISSAVFTCLAREPGTPVPSREIRRVALAAGAMERPGLASSAIEHLRVDTKDELKNSIIVWSGSRRNGTYALVATVSFTNEVRTEEVKSRMAYLEEVKADFDLLQRIKAGDASGGTALYEKYARSIYRYAVYKVGNQTDAEDIVGDVFANAFEAIGTFEWQEKPLGFWLIRIARNIIIDRWRRLLQLYQTTRGMFWYSDSSKDIHMNMSHLYWEKTIMP